MFQLVPGPGNSRAVASVRNGIRNYRVEMRGALADVGRKNTAVARSRIRSTRKTGRIYILMVRGRRVRHQSSAPGESPANLTGTLLSSVDYKLFGHLDMEFGADTPYARDLELGASRRNLAARPYLTPTVRETSGFAYTRLSLLPLRALQGGTR